MIDYSFFIEYLMYDGNPGEPHTIVMVVIKKSAGIVIRNVSKHCPLYRFFFKKQSIINLQRMYESGSYSGYFYKTSKQECFNIQWKQF